METTPPDSDGLRGGLGLQSRQGAFLVAVEALDLIAFQSVGDVVEVDALQAPHSVAGFMRPGVDSPCHHSVIIERSDGGFREGCDGVGPMSSSTPSEPKAHASISHFSLRKGPCGIRLPAPAQRPADGKGIGTSLPSVGNPLLCEGSRPVEVTAFEPSPRPANPRQISPRPTPP